MKNINEFESNHNATRRRARRKGIKVKVGNVVVKIYCDADAKAGHKAYRVVSSDAGGKLCREMFATLDEARTFAEQTAAALNNGERPYTREQIEELLKLDGRVRQWNEQLAPLGRIVDQVIADVLSAAQILPGWTCSQMATEIRARHATIKNYMFVKDVEKPFIKHIESGFKRKYSGTYIAQLKRFVRDFMVQFGSRRIDLISPEEIRDYITAMRVTPRSRHSDEIPRDKDGMIPAEQKTKQALYNCLAALFRHARDLLQALPAEERTAVERLDRPEAKLKIPQVYLPRNIAACFGVLPDVELILFVAVQVYAGLRPCEARDLFSDDIVPDDQGIPVAILVRHHIAKQTATSSDQVRTRKAPITPPLAALLRAIKLPKGKLFPRTNMQSYALEFLCQAGVAPKHDAFRHTWVSFRLEVIKDRNQVAIEAGHTTDVQMDSYEGLVLTTDVKPYWAYVPSVEGLPWHAKIPPVTTLRYRRKARQKAAAQGAE